MKHFELQAMRKHMTLDVADCAAFIGNVSNRTWQYWESGKYVIPQDVFHKMIDLRNMREAMYNKIIDSHDSDDLSVASLCYYHRLEDYLADFPAHTVIEFKLYQSVVCQCFYERRAYLYEKSIHVSTTNLKS